MFALIVNCICKHTYFEPSGEAHTKFTEGCSVRHTRDEISFDWSILAARMRSRNGYYKACGCRCIFPLAWASCNFVHECRRIYIFLIRCCSQLLVFCVFVHAWWMMKEIMHSECIRVKVRRGSWGRTNMQTKSTSHNAVLWIFWMGSILPCVATTAVAT